jgi:hypothetical protein
MFIYVCSYGDWSYHDAACRDGANSNQRTDRLQQVGEQLF